MSKHEIKKKIKIRSNGSYKNKTNLDNDNFYNIDSTIFSSKIIDNCRSYNSQYANEKSDRSHIVGWPFDRWDKYRFNNREFENYDIYEQARIAHSIRTNASNNLDGTTSKYTFSPLFSEIFESSGNPLFKIFSELTYKQNKQGRKSETKVFPFFNLDDILGESGHGILYRSGTLYGNIWIKLTGSRENDFAEANDIARNIGLFKNIQPERYTWHHVYMGWLDTRLCELLCNNFPSLKDISLSNGKGTEEMLENIKNIKQNYLNSHTNLNDMLSFIKLLTKKDLIMNLESINSEEYHAILIYIQQAYLEVIESLKNININGINGINGDIIYLLLNSFCNDATFCANVFNTLDMEYIKRVYGLYNIGESSKVDTHDLNIMSKIIYMWPFEREMDIETYSDSIFIINTILTEGDGRIFFNAIKSIYDVLESYVDYGCKLLTEKIFNLEFEEMFRLQKNPKNIKKVLKKVNKDLLYALMATSPNSFMDLIYGIYKNTELVACEHFEDGHIGYDIYSARNWEENLDHWNPMNDFCLMQLVYTDVHSFSLGHWGSAEQYKNFYNKITSKKSYQ